MGLISFGEEDDAMFARGLFGNPRHRPVGRTEDPRTELRRVERSARKVPDAAWPINRNPRRSGDECPDSSWSHW